MKTHLWRASAAVLLGGLLAPTPPAAAQVQERASGKMAISASSREAIQLFLQGRDLAEKLRSTDARHYYEQAIAKDPNFAFAHLALANTAPSAKEYFESLKRAVALADNASEGERLWILATDAGVKGELGKQKEHLTQLVQAFPGDERAHTVLANYHYGRQEWEQAIQHYTHATEINPDYSPPYNSMGYAQRALGNYGEAETAFQKYIELIPNEPNPYDSYAELLMKMGRFEESIVNYKKALSHDANFVASYVGIGNNQMFLGRIEEARATFGKLYDEVARTDGERRTAMVWTAASYVHQGDYKSALGKVEAMYGIAEKSGDRVAMASDLGLMGNILLHSGDPDGALAKYSASVETMETADAPAEVKKATRRNHLYSQARVALAKGDIATAKAKAAAYGEQVRAHEIPFELRQHHELMGRIALHERDYGTATRELAKANQQNPQTLYLMAKAHRGAGDEVKAREFAERATDFNALSFNYAYVRASAAKMLKGM